MNPTTRACRRLVDDVLAECRRRGVVAEVAATRRAGDATVIARDALANTDFDLLVSVGGDGTAMEIVSAIAASTANAHATLAVVPAGTANILARTFGIPMRPAEAIRSLFDGRRVSLDLGRLPDNRRFAIGLGVGLDAAMIARATPAMKRWLGWGAYVLSAGLAGIRLPSFRARIVADGTAHELETSSILVANFGIVAGGLFRFADGVTHDDGVLDACVYSPRSRFDAARIAWRMRRGTVHCDRCFRGIPGRSFTIETDPSVAIQADGELLGNGRIDVTVEPRAAAVLMPA